MPDLAELLAAATDREVLQEAPGKSGARLERLVIGREPYVLKHMDLASDWTMRATGCLHGAAQEVWERNLLGRLPDCINQPIVAAARQSQGCALLMRDVSRWLVPATDEPIGLGQHLRFVAHMAASQPRTRPAARRPRSTAIRDDNAEPLMLLRRHQRFSVVWAV